MIKSKGISHTVPKPLAALASKKGRTSNPDNLLAPGCWPCPAGKWVTNGAALNQHLLDASVFLSSYFIIEKADAKMDLYL
jgi:hypothetical protein